MDAVFHIFLQETTCVKFDILQNTGVTKKVKLQTAKSAFFQFPGVCFFIALPLESIRNFVIFAPANSWQRQIQLWKSQLNTHDTFTRKRKTKPLPRLPAFNGMRRAGSRTDKRTDGKQALELRQSSSWGKKLKGIPLSTSRSVCQRHYNKQSKNKMYEKNFF